MSEISTYTIEDFKRVLPPDPPPKAPPAQPSKGNGVDHSEDEKLKRASAYLAKITGAVEGDHGDQATYEAAAKMWDFGLSEEECFPVMKAGFNPRCTPEWTDQELKGKIHNAYKYAKGIPGSKLDEVRPHSENGNGHHHDHHAADSEDEFFKSDHQQNDAPEPEPEQSQEWDEPIPFFTANLPRIPVDALPKSIGDYVRAIAIETQTPVDLPAMLSLSVMAAACAKKVVVQVRPGFIEPVNIYTVSAIASANRKSAIFKPMVSPIEACEKSETKRIAPEIAKQMARYKILEKSLTKMQEMAAKATDPEKERILKSVAEGLAETLEATKVPAYPRFLADDCSPERLAGLLNDQHGRMALMSAEGDLFEIIGGRYSGNGAPNLNVYLKGHSGDELRVDRVNRPPEFIPNPAITIGLTVQPEVIEGLASKPGFRGKGLLARFLYAMPKSYLGNRKSNPPTVPAELTAAYDSTITGLLRLPLRVDTDGDPSPHVLHMDDQARQTIILFMGMLEPKLAPLGELGFISDWAGKLTGAIARIAGLIHLAENAFRAEPWANPITDTTVCEAILIGEYLIPHAVSAFGSMGADPVIEAAKHILAWIRKTGLAEFTKRDAWQALRGRYRSAGELDPHLLFLTEQGYIREKQQAKGKRPGRPSKVFEVNPNFGDIGDIERND